MSGAAGAAAPGAEGSVPRPEGPVPSASFGRAAPGSLTRASS